MGIQRAREVLRAWRSGLDQELCHGGETWTTAQVAETVDLSLTALDEPEAQAEPDAQAEQEATDFRRAVRDALGVDPNVIIAPMEIVDRVRNLTRAKEELCEAITAELQPRSNHPLNAGGVLHAVKDLKAENEKLGAELKTAANRLAARRDDDVDRLFDVIHRTVERLRELDPPRGVNPEGVNPAGGYWPKIG